MTYKLFVIGIPLKMLCRHRHKHRDDGRMVIHWRKSWSPGEETIATEGKSRRWKDEHLWTARARAGEGHVSFSVIPDGYDTKV